MSKVDLIRLQIGNLLREQISYQSMENDTQLDIIERKINHLQSKLLQAEIDDNNDRINDESYG